MRGRLFEVAWQESDTPETLKGAYQKERDPEVRTRLHGLWLLRCGWSLRRVAEALGIHYRSVQRWVAWYRQGGLPQVMRHKMGGRGRPPLLRPEQENQVRDAVATGRFRTAWEIRDWIAQQYRTNYTLGGVYNLLKRLKCASKVSHPVHAKPDRQVQAAWKKGIPHAGGQNKGSGCAPSPGGTGSRPPSSNFPSVMRHDEGGATSQLGVQLSLVSRH
jgi:transposase